MSDGRHPRFVILAEGAFGLEPSKTAASAIRYLPDRVAAVLDTENAGREAADVLGIGEGIPVVADLREGLEVDPPPEALLVGIAPQGGALPDVWRPIFRRAIEAGLEIWSGLHTRLSDDPELGPLAEEAGVRLRDLRHPPADLPVATGRAAETEALRVLTVGADCNVGKMTTALEIRSELEARGVRARFAGTGQTGILIDGDGIAVDAVISDFTAGAAERVTLEAADGAEVVLVEGQGSLLHPGYSGVTLGLLHGSMPQAMVLCWMPGREHIYSGSYDWVTLPPIEEIVDLYERAASWIRPPDGSRVVALSCCTYDLPEAEARRAIEEARERTGLPVTDPIRYGVGPLADAVLAATDG